MTTRSPAGDPEQRGQPGDELLGADRRQDVARVDGDVEAPRQRPGDRLAQLGRAVRGRVARDVRGRAGERGAHHGGHGVDGGADGEVDDPAGMPRGDRLVGREGVPGEVGELQRPHSSVFMGGQVLDPLRVGRHLADLGRATGRAQLVEEVDVRLGVGGPLVLDVVFVVDGLDRADRLARPAVDALVGVDVEHPRTLVDAVDRTLLDAGLVEQVDAGLGDHVGHGRSSTSGFLVPVQYHPSNAPAGSRGM